MSATEIGTRGREYLENVVGRRDSAAIDDYITSGYVNHLFPPGMPQGPEGEKMFMGMFEAGFPDYSITVEDVVAQGDRAALRWRFRGTHSGDFQGIPATGKPVDVQGINLLRFEGDRIAENWPSFDQLGMMQQLGLAPGPGGSER